MEVGLLLMYVTCSIRVLYPLRQGLRTSVLRLQFEFPRQCAVRASSLPRHARAGAENVRAVGSWRAHC